MAFIGLTVEPRAPLPGIPKAVRPFSGIAVLFVPDEFLRPQPALPA